MVTRIGFLDSGLGLVSFADMLQQLAPDVDVVLAMDPDNMPYGALEPDHLRRTVLRSAECLAQWQPDAIVVACNTASVLALPELRAKYEPGLPIIGTVPAVKSAAALGRPFAIWATEATTGSDYQRALVDSFATGLQVEPVACPGLAEAIEQANELAITEAIDRATAATSDQVGAVVLGCTHYGLVGGQIRAALEARTGGRIELCDSPAAVARQTLRRVGRAPGPSAVAPDQQVGSILATYQSGRLAQLPEVLSAYPAGQRLLARQRVRT